MRFILMTPLVLATALTATAHANSYCNEYGKTTRMGQLDGITESSGMAMSYLNDGVIWTHNDSGDSPTLYAVDEAGNRLLTVHIEGAEAIDWEGMEIGPCVEEGCSCIYLADMGDNGLVRGDGTIYKVIEPLVDSRAEGQTTTIPLARALSFEYPDGPHNAETFVINPRTGIPYIVTKDDGGRSEVYRFPEANPAILPAVMVKVADLDFIGTGPLGRPTTGGAVSGDGSRLIVRTYKEAWEWAVNPDDFDATFDEAPLQVKLPRRKQGEAISYSPDGTTIWTTTEGDIGMIDRLPCVDGAPVSNPVDDLTQACAEAIQLP